MKFKNPWGQGSDSHDKWFKNKWKDGDGLFDRLENAVEDTVDSIAESEVVVTKVALAFWGGARTSSDNGAFKIAAANTQSSYGKTYKNTKEFAKTGDSIIYSINAQGEDTIGRMDIVTHAGPTACYLVRNKDTYASGELADIPSEPADVRESNNLWASATSRAVESGWAVPTGDEQATIYDIETNRFANDAVIEFHGCRIADRPDLLIYDNIAQNLSEYFYDEDKTRVVVIGHATKANPNINGDGTKTKIKDQDYRHGKRIAVHNGKILFTTTRKRLIGKNDILTFLEKKEENPETYDGTNETL